MTKVKKVEIKKADEIQDLINQLYRMVDDRDKKCESAKKHLNQQLIVTAEKYVTATGTHEALRVMRSILPDDEYHSSNTLIRVANSIATLMSDIASIMAMQVDSLDYEEMDQLCVGRYDENFAEHDSDDYRDLVKELMVLDLCRNVGPACDDIVGFYDRANEEIAEITHKLDELDPDWSSKYEPDYATED